MTTQSISRNFSMYNAPGFFNYRMDAWRMRTGVENPPYSFVWSDFEFDLIENQRFVNWEKLALNDALLTSHSLSYSAGTEKSNVYSSLNYFTQDGIIPNSGFDRLLYKLNYSHQLTEKISLDGVINIQTQNKTEKPEGSFWRVSALSLLPMMKMGIWLNTILELKMLMQSILCGINENRLMKLKQT